jgi:uncharacterized membrane-anchored protein YhcB (DUF1043 family)
MSKITNNKVNNHINEMYNKGASDSEVAMFIANYGAHPNTFTKEFRRADKEVINNIRKVYEDGGDDESVEEYLESIGVPPDAYTPDNFSKGERIAAGAFRFTVPIAGAIAGGKAGAAIGTAAAPGVGTAIGGGLGMVAGGAIGSFSGSLLGDKMSEEYGAEKTTSQEKIEKATKEAALSVGFDVATLGAGKFLKGPVTAGLKKASKKVRRLEVLKRLSKKSSIEERKIQFNINKLKKEMSSSKESVKNIQKDIKKNAIPAINKLGTEVDKMTSDLSVKLAKASDDSLRELGKEYDKLGSGFLGKTPINLDYQMAELSKIAEAKDPLILRSTSKIQGILKRIEDKDGVVTLKDGIKLRQTLNEQERRLFKRGGESAALADEIFHVRQNVDNLLDIATDGLLSDLNKRYRKVLNLSKANKLFSDDLLRAGDVGIETAAEEAEIGIRRFAEQAGKEGESFFRVIGDDMEKAIEEGQPIFRAASKGVLKITNQSKILRETNIPELVEAANAIDNSLFRIAKTQVTKETLEKNLKELGLQNGMADKLALEVHEEMRKNPSLSPLFKDEKIDKETFQKLSETLSKSEKDLMFQKKRSLDLSSKIEEIERRSNYIQGPMSVLAGGGAISSMLFASGSPRLGSTVAAMTGLASASQLAPRAAVSLAPVIKNAGETLLKTGSIRNEIAKQGIEGLINSIEESEESRPRSTPPR